jgi:alanyl-tRNA synthetase
LAGQVSKIGDIELTVAETSIDDRAELGRLADRFRQGREAAVLVLFGSGGRGSIHVALTDDLVRAGRRAGDLVNRIAAVSGGKGGGRPAFASAGAGDPTRLTAARAATADLVSAWLNEGQAVPVPGT